VTYQARVWRWVVQCFGTGFACDPIERAHRFLEESLERAQAVGCTEEDAVKLVAYVYGRPVGVVFQEVGGVSVTLVALCAGLEVDGDDAAETELARCWQKFDRIREKNAAKAHGMPLPGSVT